MVDVSAKPVTRRRALASGSVHLQPETLQRLLAGRIEKGAVLEVARVAGIQAAKRTFEWIPLCHPVPLSSIRIDFDTHDHDGRGRIGITAEAVASDRTGVEMEALVAVSAAALTIYDMLKAIDRGIEITDICLQEKEGGRSGHFVRAPDGGGRSA